VYGPEVVAALVAGIVSMLVALVNLVLTSYRLHSEQARWERDFQKQREQWERDFQKQSEQWREELDSAEDRWEEELGAKLGGVELALHRDLARARRVSYPKVFQTLGRISDVGQPTSEPCPKEHLLNTLSSELFQHLYGDAGLLMEMPTRNALHRAWVACLLHSAGEIEWRQLQGYFFWARRWLRADLGIKDAEEIPIITESTWKKYHLFEADEKIDKLEHIALVQGIDLSSAIDLGPLRE
jgi:hypothetical protein